MTCYEQIISLYKEESCTPKDWRNHTLTDCRCEDKELLVLFKPLFVNIQLITIKQALCCPQFSFIYVIDPSKKKIHVNQEWTSYLISKSIMFGFLSVYRVQKIKITIDSHPTYRKRIRFQKVIVVEDGFMTLSFFNDYSSLSFFLIILIFELLSANFLWEFSSLLSFIFILLILVIPDRYGCSERSAD